MAISHHKGVPLQSEYLFHANPPVFDPTSAGNGICDRHHALQFFLEGKRTPKLGGLHFS
jgi:hypothetical protein